ncbi:hypothetical protein QAD02_021497 [Eretmocerus hayati]|uniref:Uncharacterized protein n=1 Tax=Eretmocerus hayati TaxID=131215 RepID=A0ACC2PQ30_9HYME|nr:hypothetical protein QAD02_021497 [Eretmocerus hayati]
MMNVGVTARASVTAQARIKLYEYLDILGRSALYWDTDSIIWLDEGKPGDNTPGCGPYLGDLTDEIESYGKGSYIKSFQSVGLKFYAYIIRKPDGQDVEVCKVKR